MAAVTARYARALADVVFEQRLKPGQVQSDLNDFAAAWHESAGLREVFLDPSFPSAQKVAILDKLNTHLKLSPQVRNFIAVLINHDRMDFFEDVLEDFRHEMNHRLNIAEAEITSARPLDASERKSLEAQVARLTTGAVSTKFREDPALLGGVIIRIGSTVYDDSVRGRINRLREQLAAS
ncbi:MAG TPA: ATP synthase F1 subunit delta [Acidobacteriaceae bacterium]|nr:ATP synthase F1 subunit delta [Acidobacteriaceae bacterium]